MRTHSATEGQHEITLRDENSGAKKRRVIQRDFLRVGSAVVLGITVMSMTALSASAQKRPNNQREKNSGKMKQVKPKPKLKRKQVMPKPKATLKKSPSTVLGLFRDDRVLLSAPTVDAWFRGLKNWTSAHPTESDAETSGRPDVSTENNDGRDYTVTRTKHSITETPEDIVTFQPVNGFWLGGLVQAKGLQLGLGSMQEIGVEATKRAPFKISSDLPIARNFRSISAPSATTASSAIGDLLGSRTSGGGARTLKIVDNYNEEQTAHDLGLNASYLTGSLKTAFKADRLHSKHTITAAFIERAATFQADFEGHTRRTAFFKNNFTVEDAKNLTTRGLASNYNLPAYIKSITYGRVVIFNLTSTLDESEMHAVINASASSGAFNIDTNYEGSNQLKNTTFELRVTTLGGGQQTFGKLVPATGISNVLQVMNTYLKQSVPLSKMVPISYSANTLRDDQLAALSRTTEYTVTKYVPHPIGEHYKIKMWVEVRKADDGFLDNTLECYGKLRVNGEVWWEIPRNAASANKREKGQTLEVSDNAAYRKRDDFTFDYFYDTEPTFNIDFTLKDHDSGSGDDTFGKWNKSLDLKEIAGQHKKYYWDSGDGEASTLHIRVERLDYL